MAIVPEIELPTLARQCAHNNAALLLSALLGRSTSRWDSLLA
jgi:hypothetical protein